MYKRQDMDVPEKWQSYVLMNELKSAEYPVITESKEPLETAKTLEELRG